MSHLTKTALAAACALALTPACRAQGSALQSEDIFRLETAADPQIRPQGDFVAYVRKTPDIMSDRIRNAIWLVDTRTGTQTPFATGPGNFSEPRWSPDGKRLAYLSNTEGGSSQIYVAASDGSQKVRITSVEGSPAAISWSPDGQRIAFSLFVAGKPEVFGSVPDKPSAAQWAPRIEAYTDEGYRYDAAGYLPPGTNQLFVVPADGGAPRKVSDDRFGIGFSTISWSADGRTIAFSSIRGLPWNSHFLETEIVSVDVESGAARELTRRKGPDENPAFSPDGKWIAYIGYDDHGRAYENRQLYLMRPDGSDAHSVTAFLDRSIDSFSWEHDGHRLLIAYVDHSTNRLARLVIDGRTGRAALQDRITGRFGGEYSVSGGGAIAYTTNDPYAPANIGLLAGRSGRVLTRLDEDLLSHRRLATVSPIGARSPGGTPIQGWMMTPPDVDPAKKLPMILVIHGGPFASYSDEFSFEFQRFAAAGYAVLFSNPRGSTSYGADFAHAIDKNYPGPDFADLMAVVDAAIATGKVDADNLFVTGASGGGLLTGWTVGKTHRFKAAVMQRPITNWISTALDSDNAAYMARYWFEKYPWDDFESYWRRSPLSLVGHVKTPTMLIVGSEDFRTPAVESEQFFTALRLRGVPTALLRVPGAAHQTMTSRPSQNAERIEAILAWFDRYRTGH